MRGDRNKAPFKSGHHRPAGDITPGTDILHMCMKEFYDEKIIFDKFTAFSQSSTTSHIETWLIVHTLCNQLLLERSVYPFSSLQVCYRRIEDLLMIFFYGVTY